MQGEKSPAMQEEHVSRTELKRQAKQVEELAGELANLSAAQIRKLPCDEELRQEILQAGDLKGGARKRQVKFISKELRQIPLTELLAFLEKRQGSSLKKNMAFHELERLRDAMIQEALDIFHDANDPDFWPAPDWLSSTVLQVGERFAEGRLDLLAIQLSALRFARTRKPAYKREIFRALQAAQERIARQSPAGEK
jgi:ribosome-associated protein